MEVPQRFSYRLLGEAGSLFFGCVFPATPDHAKDWVVVISCGLLEADVQPTNDPLKTCLEICGDVSELTWIDNDYSFGEFRKG